MNAYSRWPRLHSFWLNCDHCEFVETLHVWTGTVFYGSAPRPTTRYLNGDRGCSRRYSRVFCDYRPLEKRDYDCHGATRGSSTRDLKQLRTIDPLKALNGNVRTNPKSERFSYALISTRWYEQLQFDENVSTRVFMTDFTPFSRIVCRRMHFTQDTFLNRFIDITVLNVVHAMRGR